MIAIVNYGIGNLGSIQNILKKVGASEFQITSNPEEILKASKIILPGVGSFDYGISKLKESNLLETLDIAVLKNQTPTLGLCLGMQLMAMRSEEGVSQGLGWFDAEVIKFKFEGELAHLKVPHMGWDKVNIKKETKLFSNMAEELRFYFVHSYYIKCNKQEDIMMSSTYGFEFTCGIQKDNIYGVQFHPEKSHKYGMNLFSNFLKL